MRKVGINPESGEFDADIIETGQSKSQRDRRKLVLAVVSEKDGTTIEGVADIMKMEVGEIEHDVKELKKRGQLYEPEEGILPKT